MKKSTLALAVISMIVTSASAQDAKKYEKLFYKNTSVDNADVTITVDNAVSTEGETKFKMKIVNKTADYILFNPAECKFIINGKESKPTEKRKVIEPNSSDWMVVNLKGNGYNDVRNYTFELGGLSKAPTSGEVLQAPDFRLPVSKNDFKAGGYSVAVGKLTKESGKTEVSFDCAYNGDKVGILFPAKMGVKMPDGNEYATIPAKGLLAKKGPILLTKGETTSINGHWDKFEGGKSMDMQMVEMFIKWNGTFTETTPIQLKNETLKLEFDEAMTEGKK